jgi:hypothetical protein
VSWPSAATFSTGASRQAYVIPEVKLRMQKNNYGFILFKINFFKLTKIKNEGAEKVRIFKRNS